MPLSNSERQKRYRERLKIENAGKYEELRKKNLENVKKKQKRVSEMTQEEKNLQREQWRNYNKKRALKKKTNTIEQTHANTIEPTTTIVTDKRRKLMKLEDYKLENETLKIQINNLKRQVRRYKAEVNTLKDKLASLTQVQNASENTAADVEVIQNFDDVSSINSPNTKTNQFLEDIQTESDENKEKIKKNMLLMHTLTDSLKKEYGDANTNESRKILKKVALSETARKYKLKTKISNCLGLKRLVRPMKAKQIIGTKYKPEIEKFFVRDDVSRSTAGKQECVTKHKDKQQKRYLLNTIQNLHVKYRQEGGKASYVTFTRYRPFYVTTPKIQDRNTCACIKHSNMIFKLMKLKKVNVIKTLNIDELMQSVTCRECFDCMYSKCTQCSNKTPDINTNINKDSPIQWIEWRKKTHVYSKKIDNEIKLKTTKKYVKEIISGTIEDLTNIFLKELKVFKTHYFNIRHQHSAFRKCIENLQIDEVALVCDFSENYSCKQSEEIQAVHFGASRNQVTLHTCVLYQKDQQPKSICSISPSNEHSPGAIWAHLDPILRYCKSKGIIKKNHVYSDGPTTQYRQKNNFYMFTKRLSDYKFEEGTWNYFEASHGKGPADGVGGAIKRKLDQHVAHGHDITNAEEAYSYLRNNTKVTVYYVSLNDMHEITQMIPNNVIALKGTMKLHQIIYDRQNKHRICYRLLSCICEDGTSCVCGGGTKQHDLLPSIPTIIPTNTKQEEKDSANKKKKDAKIKEEHKNKEVNASKQLKNRKKTRKRVISLSSEDDTDITIEYADNDESCCMTEDSVVTEFELDEKTGFLKRAINPNKKVTVLSSVIIKKPYMCRLKDSSNS